MFMKRIMGAAALGAALMLGSGLLASPAQAGYIVTLKQVGGNVVATGSGPIDLTGLSLDPTQPDVEALISPVSGVIRTGPAPGLLPVDLYHGGITGPTSFGNGTVEEADSGDFDMVEIGGSVPELNVPLDYVSGDPLSSTATWLNQTFATLGVTPGTYVWEWGDAENQNFTLIIGPTAVPEPASVALLGMALAGLLVVGILRRIQNTA